MPPKFVEPLGNPKNFCEGRTGFAVYSPPYHTMQWGVTVAKTSPLGVKSFACTNPGVEVLCLHHDFGKLHIKVSGRECCVNKPRLKSCVSRIANKATCTGQRNVLTNLSLLIHSLPRCNHMRIAIYARVSTRRQDEMNQLLQLREFVSQQDGWTLEHEYVDKVSGSGRKERPQFQEMMTHASQKKFDHLVFWSLDRLSREGIVRTITYLEQLKGWGVGWRSYTQSFLDTGNAMVNGIVLSVLAAVAQQERITISERVTAGLQRARKAGKVLGRPEVKVDVARARKLLREGGLRPTAAKLGCSVNTLRNALA